jgi:hypothetical protein
MPQNNQPRSGSLKRDPFAELKGPNQLPPRNNFKATEGNATQSKSGSLKRPNAPRNTSGGKRRKRTRKRKSRRY